MRVAVSLVVPTYRTNPDHLRALVESVDRLTLPADAVELIFVDDGSPDDTFDRVRELAASRPRTIARQIPNSGWPCRPRNVGTELAHGDYVLYLDHDDVLYPDGLEHAYAFGVAHDADIVNIKESKTRGWSWGWESFSADTPPSEQPTIASLLPLTPHKLYRRTFLLEQDIRFEEGRRLLWEDMRFNMLALARGARVAVFGSRACYYWVRHETNNSKTLGVDPREKWRNLSDLLDTYVELFPPGELRDELLLHTYRGRFLDRLGKWMLTARPARLEFEVEQAAALAETHLPIRLDRRLEPLARARALCLRTQDLTTARELALIEGDLRGTTAITEVGWQGSRVLLTIEAELRSHGLPLRLTRDSAGRLQRDVDARIRAALGQDQLDFAEVADTGVLQAGLKARDTRDDWQIGAAGPLPLVPVGQDRFVVSGRHTAEIDFAAGLFGRPLERQPYDVSISATMLGRRFHAAAPGPAGLVRYALIDGVGVIVYTNLSRGLSLDIGERFRIVAAQAASPDAVVEVHDQEGRPVVEIVLPDVHVHGETRLPGTVLLTHVDKHGPSGTPPLELEAILIGTDDTARIRTTPTMINPGTYRIAVRFQSRTAQTERTVTVPGSSPLRRFRKLIKRG